jgi:hypothetical protein
MEKFNGVWSNWVPTWSLNFSRNICTPLSLTLQSMSINKSRLMCSLKCFVFLWKGGREGEDEGFLYGKMHVGQICYPIPDEAGLLNFCLFCSAAKSTAEVINFIVSFNVRLRPAFARRDHRHRPRWLWPALLSQPVGDTQYLCNAQDDGQSSENFATVLLESSVQLDTTMASAADHAETSTYSSSTTIQGVSTISPSYDRCVIYNADIWFSSLSPVDLSRYVNDTNEH